MSERSTRILTLFAFGAVYLIWGSTYLAIRFAIETLPPFLMAGVRFLTAGSLLYAWQRLRGTPAPNRTQWRHATVIGAFLLLGGNGGVVWAEQYVPSGLTALLVSTEPLWIVLLSWLAFNHQRPNAKLVFGMLLGFSGVAILIGPQNLSGASSGTFVSFVVLLAAASWALGSLYSIRHNHSSTPLLTISMQMLAGGALLLTAGLVTGEWRMLNLEAVSLRSLLALSHLIIFGSMVAFSAYIWLLSAVSPARASTYAFVNPVIAVLLGWAIAGEPITTSTMIAAVLIIGAVTAIVLNTSGEKKTADAKEGTRGELEPIAEQRELCEA